MKAVFQIDEWKKLMKACSGVAEKNDKRPVSEYIRLECSEKDCIVTVVNAGGSVAFHMRIGCQSDGNAVFYVKPHRIPLGAYAKVEVTADDANTTVSYVGEGFTAVEKQERFQPAELFPVQDFFDFAVIREQAYGITLNPKMLVQAVQPFCDLKDTKVSLYFGNQIEPILIAAYDTGSYREESLCYPLRIKMKGNGL